MRHILHADFHAFYALLISFLLMASVLVLSGCKEDKEGFVTGQDALPSDCSNRYGHEFWKYASTEDVRAALELGEDVNAKDENGNTPLHIVARYNREPAQVALLLDNGADVDARNNNEITPLNFALTKLLLGAREDPYPNLEVIALLLERGADPNAKGYSCYRHAHGQLYRSATTVLHSALDSNLDASVVELLLKHGADANLSNGGRFPLHEAAANGNINAIELLLKHGADPNAKDYNGNTPLFSVVQLHYAPEAVSDILATLIEHGADPNIGSPFETPLYIAVERERDIEVIETLLEYQTDINALFYVSENETLLHVAARNPNAEIVELLLDQGADINGAYGDSWFETPLHLAALFNTNLDVIALLLERGADINAKDYQGWTPLHSAAHSPIPEVIELLLYHGADINAKDYESRTPLHVALTSWPYHINREIVSLMLERGADANATDESGSTPLHIAARNNAEPAVITLLLQQDADIGAIDENGNTPCKISKDEDRTSEVRNLLCQ